MAEKKFLVDLNLTGNQLIDFRVENIGTLPTGLTPNDEGRVVFLTTDSKLHTWDGTQWTTASDTLLSVDVVTDALGVATIQPGVVDSGKLANGSVLTDKIVNANVTNAKIAPAASDNRIKGTITTGGGVVDMTPADVLTMIGVEAGAQVNVDTNIGQSATATPADTLDLTSSTGTGTTLVSATAAAAGLMSGADKAILDALNGVTAETIASTPSPTGINVALGTGSNTDLALADATNAGLMSFGDFPKLALIDNNANYINPATIVYRDKATMPVGDLQTIVTWIESDIAGNDDNNSVLTSAAVKAYVDGQWEVKVVIKADIMLLLTHLI